MTRISKIIESVPKDAVNGLFQVELTDGVKTWNAYLSPLTYKTQLAREKIQAALPTELLETLEDLESFCYEAGQANMQEAT